MNKMILRCVFALSLLVIPAAASAQGQATLQITVRDASGVLPGAGVTLARADAPQAPVGHAATDDKGVATLQIAPGTYNVTVTFSGFADASKNGVAVAAGAPVAIDIVMTLPQFSTQVTVSTPNRREQLLLTVADPTVLIDKNQIADSGARTAKDLLVEQNGSGIQVNAGGGQGHLSLNGIPNSGVLVLIDGRRYLGKDANGNLNLEDLPLTGIDRVEVVKGAGSALYGSDAIGGVVNFVTRQSRTPGITSLLDLSGGSYGDARFTETLGWRGSRGGVSASGGYRHYDGFDLSASNPQTIGQPRSNWWSATLNGDARLGNRVSLKLGGDYSKRDIDNYYFSGATQLASTVYDSQRALTRYSVLPSADIVLSSSSLVSVGYTAGWYLRDETRVYPSTGAVLPQAPWREWNDELKVTGSQTWHAFDMEHPLQGGLERRHEKLQRGSISVQSPSRDITTVWVQQEFHAGARLTLTGGFRYDDFSDFGAEWSPKASATYELAPRHHLRFSAGHGYRPPYFGELYLYTPPVFVGNPDLKPETANTYNAGYSWAGSRAQVSADYFHADVTNGITFDLSGFPYTYANLRAYTSQGMNLSGAVTLPGGFTPSAAYTYTNRQDADGMTIGGLSPHAATIRLLWANERLGIRANIRGDLLSAQPPADDGTYQPAYQVWNGQVAVRIVRRGANAMSLYAQVGNIFDKRDVFLYGADGQPVQGQFQAWIAPRTFLVGLTVDVGGR